MSPRTGRPAKDEEERKNIRYTIRLTSEEYLLLTQLAEQLGISKANTILRALHLLAEQK